MVLTLPRNSCLVSGLVNFLAENLAKDAWEDVLSKVPESDPVSSKWEDFCVRSDLGLSFSTVKRQLSVGDLLCLELCGGDSSSDGVLSFHSDVFSSFAALMSFFALFSLATMILCFLSTVSLSFLDSSLMSL
jgi:hypothetical protein